MIVHSALGTGDRLVPDDAKVEMNAKVVAGYFTNKKITDIDKILKT